ncbi:bifunctional diguanylate cyclase/phosphodiesterase [Pectobacterium odoriferum]|uniref:diguanylate cyclase n=1 Tax=Pectobacterium odoriferum TaxID=78398 RepID=A0ABD6VTF6_9GAMM|nr:EAL domain-containing protein [Pectobacterium odoriferum]AIU88381.1 diguanylate cyclase [Pectobacterium odoriferum]KGA38664.1 diguanylate cyclase [Pectobacterium odoriferum]MBA0189016.1 EAL domain-containing protein [Pectobacterium odoriferum]POD94902.1 bifunctional diguanylate cyclase/phosphodiesterase [Pectobacterium odoriferum]POD98373.1 bifunctional diguanylate cyclase/phosphodiesterase [Pectobacterium odoriferum]
MSRAPISKDEDKRLAALREYEIKHVLFDPGLSNLISLAANIFSVPIVLVSLVEAERQLFAANVGVPFCETPRDISFCAHTIRKKKIMVVPDALKDARFKNNPLVVGVPYIRFYAGIPLITPSGHAIGTLCIIDLKPRTIFTKRDEHNLQDLASLVMDKLEMRRLELARKASQVRFENIANTSPDTILCVNEKGMITFWNTSAEHMLEYTDEEIIGRSINTIVPDAFVVQLNHLVTDRDSLMKGVTLELNVQAKGGSLVPVELSVSMWEDNDNVSYGAILRDITERRRNEERLFLLAHLDPLTGLANRTLLTSNLETALKNEPAVCIMMVDLDGFKDVNDSLGHSSGDNILVHVAKKIKATVRSGDVVARMGGDEFALLFPGLNDKKVAGKIAEQIIHEISQAMIIDDHQINISASIGAVLYPEYGVTVQDLLTSADLALYQAKSEGRNCYRFFTRELLDVFQAKHAFQLEFVRAYEQHEFEMFYQPQVKLATNEIVGAEALLRWRHPERGLLSPAAFLTALENGPWAERIGDWIVETACRQAAEWCQASDSYFRISINLFSAQFRTGMLAQKIMDILARTGLQPSSLELEITENIILRYDESMLQPLNMLREAGIGIAFDDYGTGYASLSMLKNYPVTRLKIDQTFVRTMCESPPDAAIVRAILYLGKSFGLGVIAEGVETLEQSERLRGKGCEEAQGYLFGHPMPAEEFTQLLKLNKPIGV